ncbi:MAG: helix-turn-helix domain-containing protein [Fimbriimonadaceae bacterium]|nr:helix-turn-helix domain-containing protein [Fimbriimonadaceae bacterium]
MRQRHLTGPNGLCRTEGIIEHERFDQSQITKALVSLGQESMIGDQQSIHKQAVRKAMEHIQRCSDRPLTVRSLAAIACFSPQHFQRIFASVTGESVMDHVRQKRIERAALQLVDTDLAVAEVANSAGYRTHEAFTRAFRSVYERSPSEFRTQASLCAYHRSNADPLAWLMGEVTSLAKLSTAISIQNPEERNIAMNTLTVDHEVDAIVEEIEVLKKKLSEAQRRRPSEDMPEYLFEDWDGNSITLAELFQGRDDMILVHNMGTSCPDCTLWADGFNGFTDHLNSRATFVLVSNDKPEIQKKFAEKRGWRFRMVSSHSTSFFKDLGFEKEDGFWPAVSTFKKDATGKVSRVGRAIFWPGDEYCAIWSLLDLLDGGTKGWEPKYDYS